MQRKHCDDSQPAFLPSPCSAYFPLRVRGNVRRRRSIILERRSRATAQTPSATTGQPARPRAAPHATGRGPRQTRLRISSFVTSSPPATGCRPELAGIGWSVGHLRSIRLARLLSGGDTDAPKHSETGDSRSAIQNQGWLVDSVPCTYPRGLWDDGSGRSLPASLSRSAERTSDPNISRKGAANEASSLYRNRMCSCVCDMCEE
jgi:hypothetical protein